MGFLSNYKFVMGHQHSQIQFVHRKFNVKYAPLGNRFSCWLYSDFMCTVIVVLYTPLLCFCRGIGFTWFAFETSFFI